MGDITRQDEQRETMAFDNAARVRHDFEKEGARTLVARLRSVGKGGASYEEQAARRIETLERGLRDVLASDTLERAKGWARYAL